MRCSLLQQRVVRRAGFTLIELLIIIAVVALLTSILLPALSHARRAGQVTLSFSNLRQLHVVFSLYHSANDDEYPATLDGQSYQVGPFEWVDYPYWQVFFTWPGVVYDIFPCSENQDIYLSPLDPSRRDISFGWPSSYEYSTSFVGHPYLWAENAAAEERLKVAQRLSAVAMPSSKALLWDRGAYPPGSLEPNRPPPTSVPVPTMLADGSCRTVSLAEAAEPIANPFEGPVRKWKLHNTPMGVQGLDYQ